MTVKQTNNGTDNVTINVSGITEGDRQLYIWITGAMRGSEKGDWYTWQKAKEDGYIRDLYVADYEKNNGDITIWFSWEYAESQKVWILGVVNTLDGNKIGEADLYAALTFDYQYSYPKMPGEEIDITKYDMYQMNECGRWLDAWLASGKGTWFPLDYITTDEIHHEYLVAPAQNIWNAAFENRNDMGTHYSIVNANLTEILDNCAAETPVAAVYFNNIHKALDYFRLTVTT